MAEYRQMLAQALMSPQNIQQTLSSNLVPSPDEPGKPAFVRGNWGDAVENARRLATQTGNVGSPADWAMAFMGGPKMMRGAAGIRAYHGSPHDFERFDMSRIGTGEGAQAYGHGLYFAENEATARQYRDNLAGAFNATHPRPQEAYKAAAKSFLDAGVSPTDTLAGLRQAYKDAATPELEMAIRHARGLDAGRMYEVNINARPEQFLDWDKPLAQSPALEDIRQSAAKSFPNIRDNPDLTGQGLYQAYAQHRGGNPVVASEALREAGIPGIKYLDQGSRAGGEGTSNYVVFNDKLIDILRKFGLVGAPSAAALGQALSEPQPQQ